MPSGSNKRKSARRKKGKEEMEEKEGLVHPPDSTTNAAPDNTHDGKENTSSSSSSSSSDEEEQEQKKEPVAPLESQEAVKLHPVVEKVEEMEIPVSTEAEVVSVEFIQAEKSEVGVEESAVAAVASLVPTDAPVPLDEETIELVDGAAGTLETSLEVDSLSHEVEVKPAPILVLEETPVTTAELPRDIAEPQHDTETSEPTPAAPPAGHPASWWNCCGLLDVLTGSKGNIRA